MELTALLLAVSFVVFTAADIVKSEGKTRKVFIIVDIILIGIFAGFMICCHIYVTNIDRDREKYEINGSSLFGGISYKGETDDFYLLYERAFLSSGTDIAVPKEAVYLPATAKLSDNLLIYSKKGTEPISYSKTISIDSKEYCLCDSAVKIRPDLTWELVIIGFFDLLILYSFNALIFVIVLVQRKKETV